MSRRVTLPGADELFRATGSSATARSESTEDHDQPPVEHGVTRLAGVRTVAAGSRPRNLGPSGREKHDEKITVYVSPNELLDLEHARLNLRATHGLAVDRGRIVREAIAVVLADFADKGEQSILVRRLRGL